jgi:hypothetical protein
MSSTTELFVGGMFGRERAATVSRGLEGLLGERASLWVNGRSAIREIALRVLPRRIWLPNYACSSLRAAIADLRHTAVEHYPVTRALLPDNEVAQRVAPDDLVVVIDYFGFPIGCEFLDRCRRSGALILEDACGALFRRPADSLADFLVRSPRKFVGVPDGGILNVIRDGLPECVPAAPPPSRWQRRSIEAFERRSLFDAGDSDRSWFDLFQEVERDQPCGPFGMSPAAIELLQSIDVASITARRRHNYEILLEQLSAWALFPRLPDGVVPLGFPLLCPDREPLQRRLHQRQIYAAVHWRLGDPPPQSPEVIRELAACQLTIPCDQRLDADTMRAIAGIVRQELS